MKMTFAGAVKSGIKNYSNFKGTATRTEFWYFYLFNVLLNMVTSTIDGFVSPVDPNSAALPNGGPLYMLTNIILVIPNLSLTFRRFHDAGYSAKWLLLWAAPVVAFFVGGGYVLATNPNLNLNTATNEQILTAVMPLAPALLLAAAVGIFQLVVNLKASKLAEQGNKYAAKQDAETGVSE